jgi:hypothetical protein
MRSSHILLSIVEILLFSIIIVQAQEFKLDSVYIVNPGEKLSITVECIMDDYNPHKVSVVIDGLWSLGIHEGVKKIVTGHEKLTLEYYIPKNVREGIYTGKVRIYVDDFYLAYSGQITVVVGGRNIAKTDYGEIYLYASKTSVEVNEPIDLGFVVISYLTNDKPIDVQLIVYIPPSISVSSTEFIESGKGVYVSNFRLNPGQSKFVSLMLIPEEIGDYIIRAKSVIMYTERDVGLKISVKEIVKKTINYFSLLPASFLIIISTRLLFDERTRYNKIDLGLYSFTISVNIMLFIMSLISIFGVNLEKVIVFFIKFSIFISALSLILRGIVIPRFTSKEGLIGIIIGFFGIGLLVIS